MDEYEEEYFYAMTLSNTMGVDETLDYLGYAIEDINQDGNLELIIGSVSHDDNPFDGKDIYALYTVLDDKAEWILGSTERNRFYILEDGRIYNEGSNGAAYSVFDVSHLEDNKLVVEDYYFTYDTEEDPTIINFYHNTSGQWDPSVSEQMDVTNDEFFALMNSFEKEIRINDLTPLSDYLK